MLPKVGEHSVSVNKNQLFLGRTPSAARKGTVLSFGGFMGMGNKLFAMPWKAFEFAKTENKLVLNVDKEKLKTAPGFDQDAKWPDFADRTWGSSIYKYYGYEPYWKP